MLRSPAVGDDTVDLVDEDGGLGVTYRLRQCCCGSKKRLVIILLIVAPLLVGAVATLTYFLTSKFEAYRSEMFIHAPNTWKISWICNRRIPFETWLHSQRRLPSSGQFNSPFVTLSSSPSSGMLTRSRFIFLGFA